MAITDKKISTVYSDRDLASLSDRPNEDGLTAAQLKARFDQLPKEVIPQYNALIDELNDTVLPGKSDVGHTHDDRYFTETEVGVLLSGKSDTSHTHDGRYYTEAETDALLSGKSDTTHNHDLTYAQIVHTHDDIYYTDDEVDTLLLSKSDTTHTHDLIKNATEANAKIEASSTGAVITRNVNDANIALKVNQQQGTGKILDLQFGGVSKVGVTTIGAIQAPYIAMPTHDNYGLISLSATGIEIKHNQSDANPALKVNQANASSTGLITDFQFGGTSKASVNKDGYITGTGFRTPVINIESANIANVVDANRFTLGIGTSSTAAEMKRNIADANPVIKINLAHASSTGNIAEFQFNGTTKLAIDKNGLVPATNIANTPAGNISATTVQGALNELDNEKADKLYATNLITNGDFSNGTTGWVITNGTLSVSAGKLLATVDNTTTTRVGNPLSIVNGRKYYIRAESLDKTNLVNLTLTTRSTDLMSFVQTVDDLFSRTPLSNYSIVFTATANAGGVAFNFSPASAPATITLGKFLVIDLTAIFGAGKEPSATQMDNMLSTFPNSWFNGTAELVSIANLAQLKADKTQEAWITPTLLNSWVNFGSDYDTCGYYKDNFGNVEVKGIIKSGGTGTVIFTLPSGYRPSHLLRIPLSLTSSTVGLAVVYTNGNIEVYAANTTSVSLRGIRFKV